MGPISSTATVTAEGIHSARERAVRKHDFDVLRGGMLVWMALNHVPCALWRIAQQPLGFFTAAEGFVLISGLVAGVIYTQRFVREGKNSTTRKLMRRVCTVYGAHLMTVTGVLFWMGAYAVLTGQGQPPVGSPWAWFQDPVPTLITTIFLLHQPGLLDVLPLYCGCLLITPLALRQLMRGRSRALLAGSALLWGFTNLALPNQPTVYGIINTGAFNFGAWQFLYLLGVTAGHAYASGSWDRVLRPGRTLIAVSAALAILLLAIRHGWVTGGLSQDFWIGWSNKNNLAPLRLLNVLVLALLLRALILNLPNGSLGLTPHNRTLAILGRHSLVVFSVHVVVALVILGLPGWFEWTRWGPWAGPVLLLSSMLAAAAIADQLARQDQSR